MSLPRQNKTSEDSKNQLKEEDVELEKLIAEYEELSEQFRVAKERLEKTRDPGASRTLVDQHFVEERETFKTAMAIPPYQSRQIERLQSVDSTELEKIYRNHNDFRCIFNQAVGSN